MTRQPPEPDDTGYDQARGPTTGVPRWVTVFLLVAAGIVVLGLVVMLLVGGDHGPGRHQSAAVASHLVAGMIADWNLG